MQEAAVHGLLYLAGPQQIEQLSVCLGPWCPKQPISTKLRNHMRNWAALRLPPTSSRNTKKLDPPPYRRPPASLGPVTVQVKMETQDPEIEYLKPLNIYSARVFLG
jgi:hypothetical protein